MREIRTKETATIFVTSTQDTTQDLCEACDALGSLVPLWALYVLHSRVMVPF